jgi:choline dehydrogenase-like flavoprotein
VPVPLVGLTYSHLGNDFDVIIVGGGAVGVSAARRLAQQGDAALLREATSRLGRIHAGSRRKPTQPQRRPRLAVELLQSRGCTLLGRERHVGGRYDPGLEAVAAPTDLASADSTSSIPRPAPGGVGSISRFDPRQARSAA